jgi:hypothetical protein
MHLLLFIVAHASAYTNLLCFTVRLLLALLLSLPLKLRLFLLQKLNKGGVERLQFLFPPTTSRPMQCHNG